MSRWFPKFRRRPQPVLGKAIQPVIGLVDFIAAGGETGLVGLMIFRVGFQKLAAQLGGLQATMGVSRIVRLEYPGSLGGHAAKSAVASLPQGVK